MKRKKIILLIILFLFIANGCAYTNSLEKKVITSDQAENKIKSKSKKVIEVIKNYDLDKLAKYVHKEKGVLLSPTIVIDDNDIRLLPTQIESIKLNKDYKYTWRDKKYTIEEYYKNFIYNKDYKNAQIFYDSAELVAPQLNSLFDEALIVDYMIYEGIGINVLWQKLRLVYEKDGWSWYLVAIIHDEKL